MKIILLSEMKNLGRKGEVKEVSDGYARNFLFPRKLAEKATDQAIKDSEKIREREKAEENLAEEKNLKLAKSLEGRKIVLKSKAKGGKLFGSISAKEIIAEFQKDGLVLTEEMIEMGKPIKKIGEHELRAKLSTKISAKFKVEVKEEN